MNVLQYDFWVTKVTKVTKILYDLHDLYDPIMLLAKSKKSDFGDYIPKQLIKYKLKEVTKKGILPYGISKMQEHDPELYNIISKSQLGLSSMFFMQLYRTSNMDLRLKTFNIIRIIQGDFNG